MKKLKLLLVGLFSLCSSAYILAEPVLNVYIGTNYMANETITRLEKECHCRVQQNYFNANEEMLAKIAAGATGYNVIVPTSYAVDELVKMGKLKPLDLKRLTNLKTIDPHFLNQPYDPGNKYSVPYAYTPVFLAYNEDKMKALGIQPNTWAVIFDPEYLQKMKGRVTVFNSARNVFAAALLYLGKDPNTANPDDLNAASDVIQKASPYWAKYDSDSYYRSLLRGDIWISMSYSIDIFKTLQDIKNSHSTMHLGASLQKEGNMYELDNMVIPVFTPDENLSYEFINNALAPESAYELSTFTGASIPNTEALKKLSPSVSGIDWIYPKDMAKMHVFNAYDPKTRTLVSSLWTQIQMQAH
jgi:spermidine/putrescine transport system substrate-binding protein